jgi:hypothetical protein
MIEDVKLKFFSFPVRISYEIETSITKATAKSY